MTIGPLTRAVRLTPPGRGAISTVLVAGSRAEEIVDRLFAAANARPLAAQPLDRILLGRFDGSEELIVCRRAPQRIEVHCHGGHAAAEAVLRSLAAQGATIEDWPAAIEQDAGERLAAEAWQALAQARTLRAALVLLDQFHGALRRELEAIAQAAASGDSAAALARIDALSARSRLGLHLVEPFRVVLAGKPNVGKSSLVNRLLGYGRAITSPVPGTTRDIVTAVTALDGWPVELADTAGLHASTSELENQGILRARSEIDRADLVIFVHDASEGPAASSDVLPPGRTKEDALIVINKADLVPPLERRGPCERYVSAVSGEGIERMSAEISRRLVPSVQPEESGVPFLERHVQALARARQLVAGGARLSVAEWLALLA
ncbi:MAG TPA: GTPase [Pirellulales bacterium]|jgi:tRNA modification GTPase|nr:GTPase [Pirellulales bacterium]